ncbi:SusC/RagA family TonB-linked outer membrane protein [Proteiniphilum sp. X52]|uniref:SusC/RagA family TonB-linked outer membrane protein n=1 Tax=Proteiniphilum sp. X52 TaxID=2382159 RepID=UPI00351A6908
MTESSKVYFGIEGFYSKNTMPGISNTDNLWQALALLTPLTIPKVYSTGHIPSFNSTAGYAGGFNNFSPFVALNHTGIYTKEQGNLQGTIAIEQDFSPLIKGLKMRAQGAYTATSYFDELRRTIPEMYYATGRNVDGSLRMLRTFQAVQTMYSSGQDQYRKFFLESNITYENVFDENHRLSGLLYYYISDHKQVSSIPTYAQTLPSSLAALPIRYQGLSGRITYGYRDTYLLDLNFGYTGSENFQPGRQYGFFPSMAIGWIPTQYDFVKNGVPWLNFFKVRFSHGSVGNDRITGNRRFAYLTTFDYTGAGWGGTTGINENLVGADNLEWEKAIKSDLGIESQLFKQRLSFTVDFFNDKRDGIFQQRTQVPGYIGAVNMPYGNVGSMVSYGSDGNITYLQPVTDNLSFTVRGNFTYSRNEVKNWEQVVQKYDYQYNNGWPNGTVRGFKSLGLFRDEADVAASATQFGTVLPGDIKYKDINADGKIDDYDKIPLSLQNNFPSLMYGFGGEISYKDWTFGFLFKGTGKMEYYHVGIHDSRLGGNNGIGYIPFHDQEMGNVLSIVADQSNRWTPASYSGNPATENPNAMFPRLTYGYNENNSKLSDFWKRDGRYLRLQEVSASYKMKLQKLKKIGISSIEFQLVGSNLYTWDKVGIYHPEQAWRNGIIYPIPAQYSFQLYIHL